MTPEIIAAASAQVERYEHELDLTNADHIALWLETNTDEPRISWLAVQISDGFHHVDTSMESGPNNCFHCEGKM